MLRKNLYLSSMAACRVLCSSDDLTKRQKKVGYMWDNSSGFVTKHNSISKEQWNLLVTAAMEGITECKVLVKI